jgi:hypothetical protein
MNLVTRAQWGARPAKHREALVKSAQHGTACHYSAADADEQADHANCAKRVRAIQDFHMDGRGWADIAYSYLACKHGYVYEGRGRGVRTAAQGTNAGNDAWHAVCFLGDDTADRDDVTDAGREAIEAAVRWCNLWSGATEVRPHSWFHATACPGDDLRGWIERGMPVGTQPAEEAPDVTEEQARQLEAVYKALIVPGTTSPDQTVDLLFSRVRDIAKAVLAGVFTDAQLEVLAERLAPLVAGKLEIAGHPELEGEAVIALRPKTPTP